MRRSSVMIALVAVLGLLAAACGGTTTTADLEGQQIEVAAKWSGGEQENFQQVLDLFEKNTGAQVTFTSTGEDTAAFLGTRIEGGNPPDVAILPQPGLLADLQRQGKLKDIGSVAGSEVDANYAPVWRDLGSIGGTLYGVWFKAANKSTFWYSTKVVTDAGVTPPADWDALKAAAKTVLDSGVTPFSVGGADGWTLTDWFENVYLRTAGADNYDKLAKHEIPWTDPTVKTALTRLAEIFGEPTWLAGGTSGALQTDFPTSVTQVFASPPKAAMVYEGDFVGGVITSDTTAKLGTDADFFDFPAIGGSVPAVVGGGDVAVLLKDTAAGRELIKFLATPEAGEVWAKLGGFTSPNKNVDAAAYPDEITRKSAVALTNAETFRFDMSDLQPSEFGGTVGKGLFKQFQDFLRAPTDIDKVTAAMEASAAAAFK